VTEKQTDSHTHTQAYMLTHIHTHTIRHRDRQSHTQYNPFPISYSRPLLPLATHYKNGVHFRRLSCINFACLVKGQLDRVQVIGQPDRVQVSSSWG